MYGTVNVKLCLRSFSQAKLNRVSFHFTPKLSNLVVVITEESDFNTHKNYMTQIKEKTEIRKSVVIATVIAIRAVIKSGFHCYQDILKDEVMYGKQKI